MATIGDMLRMDENGRFTSSGKGVTVTEAIEQKAEQNSRREEESRLIRERSEHENDQIKLVDPNGVLCGYYILQQTWDMQEMTVRVGDVVRIAERITSSRKLELLRRSYQNPLITPDQQAEIKVEVDKILSARLGRQSGTNSTEIDNRRNTAARVSERHIVRDANGLYLGMYTLREAQEKWPKAEMHGSIINAMQVASFSQAASTVKRAIPNNTGYSSRVNDSLNTASSYTESFKDRKDQGYWKGRYCITYIVLHHSDEPICQVPYACLSSSFGDAWIVISKKEFQLVTSWSAEEVRKRADNALEQAKGMFHMIEKPGAACLTEAQFAKREQKRNEARKTKDRPTPINPTRPGGWVARYVTRDSRGLFLGVFSIDEAKELWPAAHVDKSVIAIHNAVAVADAVSTISHTKSFETTFSNQQHKKAVQKASKLPETIAGKDNTSFWQTVANTRLAVRNNSSMALAHLKPSEIDEAVGFGWFLVSPTEAQIVSTKSPNNITRRLSSIEVRRYGNATVAPNPGVKSSTNPSAQPKNRGASKEEGVSAKGNSRNTGSKQPPVQTGDTSSRQWLFVRTKAGKELYKCKSGKATKVRKYLKQLLPSRAYTETSNEFKFTEDVRTIGFSSEEQITRLCARAARGETPRLSLSPHTSDVPAKQIQAIITDGKVYFDGPENTLYIFKGILSCKRNGHRLESATGVLASLRGNPITINVNYCQDCRMYFLDQREYEYYRDKYGPILGNFSFASRDPSYGDGFDGLAPKSILNLCGYNVNQTEDLSSEQRHLILSNVMDRGICSKPKVMDHLQWLINSREGLYNMWLACEKWSEDLEWVRSYRIDTQRRFIISGVRRYR